MEMYQHRNIDCIHHGNNIKIPKMKRNKEDYYDTIDG